MSNEQTISLIVSDLIRGRRIAIENADLKDQEIAILVKERDEARAIAHLFYNYQGTGVRSERVLLRRRLNKILGSKERPEWLTRKDSQ